MRFDKQGLIKLLGLVKKNWVPIKFNALASLSKSPDRNHILMRKDIDISIKLALEMAVFEADLGITSTYFVLMSGDFYNPLSLENRRALRQIQQVGCELGLHFDQRFTNTEKILASVGAEKLMLEDVVEEPVSSISWHMPTVYDELLWCVDELFDHNCYGSWISSRFDYLSDSSMRFRQCPESILKEPRGNLQLLLHPVWWMQGSGGMAEKMMAALKCNQEGDELTMRELIDETNKFLESRDQHDRKFKHRLTSGL